MVTYVGDRPASIPGDVPTPPDTTPPPDPLDPPVDVPTDYEFSGSTIAALHSFIAGKPDGATIGLEAEAEITGDSDDQLHLDGRNGITIVGRNAVLSRTAQGNNQIVLIDGGGSGFLAYNVIVQGSNPDPGLWDVDFEHEHGFAIGGAINWEFVGCQVINVGGDGLYISGGADRWAKNGRFHHGSFSGIGRMGVAITDGGRDIVIDYNSWEQIGYYLWDIEPNGAVVEGILAGAINVRFSDNTIGTKPYGDYPDDMSQALGYMIASTGASGGGPAKQISVLRNTMTDGAMRVGIFNNGMTNADWNISNNVGAGTFTATGDIAKCISATAVAGLTIKGNTQTCTVDADFETHPSCTAVDISGNTL